MPRNHVVKFRVSENEWELLKTNARITGIKHVADYARHVALGRDAELEARLIENNKLLIKLCKKLKIAGVDRDTAVVGRRSGTGIETAEGPTKT